MKIAICIPCHGDTKAKFTQCLAAMLVQTMRARIDYDGKQITPEIEIFMVSCSLLTESRNRLVMEAMLWAADYMLWMDADHVFPTDALLRLLGHNLPVVGCNYARRYTPTAPTASKHSSDDETELVWTTEELADAGAVEEVSHMGLGLCLMDMRVFGRLEEQATREGKKSFFPLFRIDPTDDGVRFIGEDVFFFRKIREAGVPVHIDHGLSWEVGHIHEQILTNAHAVVQKDKWMEFNQRRLDKFKVNADANSDHVH